jgi:hypothetical protein
VHLDDEPVGAGRDRRARHRDDLGAHAGPVARVGDDRQVRQRLYDRDRGQVQEIAGVAVEAAHAALAQDDVVVPLGQDVLGGEQQLVDGGGDAPLEQHGAPAPPRGTQQRVVLHVARAYLHDVRVVRHDLDGLGIHRLGDDRETGRLAGAREMREARFAEPLERVRRRARLERTRPQHGAPAARTRCAMSRICSRLSTALGTGHHPRSRGPDGSPVAEPHHGVGVAPLAGDLLVGVRDRDDLEHAIEPSRRAESTRPSFPMRPTAVRCPPGMGRAW